MAIFSRRKKRIEDSTAVSSAGKFYFGKSASNEYVTERSAMQVTAVYACVRVLSEAVAQLPLHLYRYTGENSKEKALDHPLYELLHGAPNEEMTSFVFRETLMSHLLLWGNAYAQIIRDNMGNVVGLYPLMPDRINVLRDDTSKKIYYEYTLSDTDNKRTHKAILQEREVLHIPGLGFDGIMGHSPIAVARNAIGLSIATEKYGSEFFAGGSTLNGVLETNQPIKDIDRVREDWNNGFKGTGNVAILEDGMKYTPISISPNDSQFLETRKFQIDEIARIFRVPPHLIGDLDHSTFSNIEQQSLEFVTYSLQPWLIRWEQSIEKSLLKTSEKGKYFVKFNVDGLLRGDYQSRMSGYATARQNGWMSANDIRELENLDKIPADQGGDLYLINGNMTKMQDAGIFANKKETKNG